MENKNKCTLLINSCDAYSDVWDLFFAGLQRQWPDCPFPVLLNTESKEYKNDYGVTVLKLGSENKKDCWGKRYKKALEAVNTPYVIPILEDFVLSERFSGDALIEQCIKWMDDNQDIGVFYLHKHPYVLQKETQFEGFGQMPQKADYKLTTAFGIWRKEYLQKCIKGFETPWEWEVFVTRKAWRFKEREYALLENQKEVYVFPWGGVIWRGLWHPDAKVLAEKYGVQIDFSKRGFMDMEDPYRNKEMYSVIEHFPKDIFKWRYWIEVAKTFKRIIRGIVCEI